MEVDFIAADESGRATHAIQVCTDLTDEVVLKRELEPLIIAAKHFGTKENLVLIYNQEKTFHESGISIQAIPAWKWIMSL
ncbi:MAG: hypothetical protein GY866_24190 [Proteobacteria bacterium]|nr:hypothetical protein [Pseudomonadota bacterium]